MVRLSADVTSEIKLFIAGEELITDNGDIVDRTNSILHRAQCHTNIKALVMQVVKNEVQQYTNRKDPIGRKFVFLSFRCEIDNEHHDLVEAVTEQLCLVEEME